MLVALEVETHVEPDLRCMWLAADGRELNRDHLRPVHVCFYEGHGRQIIVAGEVRGTLLRVVLLGA